MPPGSIMMGCIVSWGVARTFDNLAHSPSLFFVYDCFSAIRMMPSVISVERIRPAVVMHRLWRIVGVRPIVMITKFRRLPIVGVIDSMRWAFHAVADSITDCSTDSRTDQNRFSIFASCRTDKSSTACTDEQAAYCVVSGVTVCCES